MRWLRLLDDDEGNYADWIRALATICTLYYWFTSSAVLVYDNAKISWLKSSNLDIRSMLALQILQSLFVICGLLLKNQLSLVVLSMMMLLWHVT